MTPKIKAETVIDHAEAAALFLRTLVDEGVPVTHAVQMACSYASGLVIGNRDEKPRRAWEDERP
jgi:hypothetical protein